MRTARPRNADNTKPAEGTEPQSNSGNSNGTTGAATTATEHENSSSSSSRARGQQEQQPQEQSMRTAGAAAAAAEEDAHVAGRSTTQGTHSGKQTFLSQLSTQHRTQNS